MLMPFFTRFRHKRYPDPATLPASTCRALQLVFSAAE